MLCTQATSVFGALHALESFSQLVERVDLGDSYAAVALGSGRRLNSGPGASARCLSGAEMRTGTAEHPHGLVSVHVAWQTHIMSAMSGAESACCCMALQ